MILNFFLAYSKYSYAPLEYSCVLGLGYEIISYEENIYEEEDINIIRFLRMDTFLDQLKNNNLTKKNIFH